MYIFLNFKKYIHLIVIKKFEHLLMRDAALHLYSEYDFFCKYCTAYKWIYFKTIEVYLLVNVEM